MHKKKVLVVAAHPDDEILGLGGTLLKHFTAGDNISIMFMSDGVTGRDFYYDFTKREQEIKERKNMAFEAGKLFGCDDITFLDFPNLRLDKQYFLEITKLIEERVADVAPDIVYTHFSGDTNIDHRITHDACIAALRPLPNKKVASLRLFEVCSSTEYSVQSLRNDFVPNLFNDITAFASQKTQLLRCYKYEMRDFPHPRSEKSIEARDVFRGTSVGVASAEAFIEVRRIIF
jgi:N-acetylglucosamine malate deacetylase 1